MVFAISKFFYNTKIEITSRKFIIRSSTINQLSSSSEINNITQKGEAIFNKNPTVGALGVSTLIDSAISKTQGDQRKNNFFEKKNTP